MVGEHGRYTRTTAVRDVHLLSHADALVGTQGSTLSLLIAEQVGEARPEPPPCTHLETPPYTHLETPPYTHRETHLETPPYTHLETPPYIAPEPSPEPRHAHWARPRGAQIAVRQARANSGGNASTTTATPPRPTVTLCLPRYKCTPAVQLLRPRAASSADFDDEGEEELSPKPLKQPLPSSSRSTTASAPLVRCEQLSASGALGSRVAANPLTLGANCWRPVAARAEAVECGPQEAAESSFSRWWRLLRGLLNTGLRSPEA